MRIENRKHLHIATDLVNFLDCALLTARGRILYRCHSWVNALKSALTFGALALLIGGCDQQPSASTKRAAPTEPATLVPVIKPLPPKKAPGPVTILSGVVTVTGFVKEENCESLDEYCFALRVRYGQQEFVVSAPNLNALDSQSIAHLKRRIGWKGGYLFVREECDGGNSIRCNIDHVFKRKGVKLIKIGEVVVWASMPGGSSGIGPGFVQGYFKDIYHGLALNEVTSHAEDPVIVLAHKEIGGRFVWHKEKTWEFNQVEYQRNWKTLRTQAKSNGKLTLNNSVLGAPLLFNAALARLTGHTKEYQNIISFSKTILEAPEVSLVEKEIDDAIRALDLPFRS